MGRLSLAAAQNKCSGECDSRENGRGLCWHSFSADTQLDCPPPLHQLLTAGACSVWAAPLPWHLNILNIALHSRCTHTGYKSQNLE